MIFAPFRVTVRGLVTLNSRGHVVEIDLSDNEVKP